MNPPAVLQERDEAGSSFEDRETRGHPNVPPGATPAIRTDNLSKSYGRIHAVQGLTVEIPAGIVAGFVGPNGAGKTTTIRMLLSLVRPTEGTVEVLGSPSTRPHEYLPRVGALIEGPAFYPGLSARRNLEILAELGGFSAERVGQLLTRVGLEGREADVVKTYSMGMRQRLGIAAALLPDPALLILDEPANGLDPAGILEIRQLIRQLKEQGVTVLVSSHLLSEVEQMADWIILLHRGKLLYQGWLEDLLEQRQNTLLVRASTQQELQIVAAEARKANYESKLKDGYLSILAPPEFAGQLNRSAMDAGVVLTELHSERPSLEETFFTLTDGEQK
jgi:ABC-2 type transport system ATP-binding protein